MLRLMLKKNFFHITWTAHKINSYSIILIDIVYLKAWYERILNWLIDKLDDRRTATMFFFHWKRNHTIENWQTRYLWPSSTHFASLWTRNNNRYTFLRSILCQQSIRLVLSPWLFESPYLFNSGHRLSCTEIVDRLPQSNEMADGKSHTDCFSDSSDKS